MKRSEYIRQLYLSGDYSYSFAVYALDALGMTPSVAHTFLISA